MLVPMYLSYSEKTKLQSHRQIEQIPALQYLEIFQRQNFTANTLPRVCIYYICYTHRDFNRILSQVGRV